MRRRLFLTQSSIICAVLVALFGFSAKNARAGRPYYEMGAGIGQIREGQSLLGSAAAGTLSIGAAVNFAFAFDFARPNSSTHFHVGAQGRLAMGSNDAGNHSFLAAYPIVRAEINRAFFGLGATPFVWRRSAASAGLGGFERASGALSFLFEAGYQWPITPQVLFALSAGTQVAKTDDGIGPKPAAEISAQLRFYIGGPANFSAASESSAFEGKCGDGYPGWRYPCGLTP